MVEWAAANLTSPSSAILSDDACSVSTRDGHCRDTDPSLKSRETLDAAVTRLSESYAAAMSSIGTLWKLNATME